MGFNMYKKLGNCNAKSYSKDMLLLNILFSLLLSNTLAIENRTEVLKNGTEVCTCATKSEIADSR